jgi:hypothetical protein
VGGPQSQSGCHEEDKNILTLLEIKPKFSGCSDNKLITILMEQNQIIKILYNINQTGPSPGGYK